jgi:hypothetical protein
MRGLDIGIFEIACQGFMFVLGTALVRRLWRIYMIATDISWYRYLTSVKIFPRVDPVAFDRKSGFIWRPAEHCKGSFLLFGHVTIACFTSEWDDWPGRLIGWLIRMDLSTAYRSARADGYGQASGCQLDGLDLV